MDYKETVNLPRTDFPMKANLPQREPEILKEWEAEKTFEKLVASNAAKGGKLFVLHDGPPYANGHIHMGTTLNKIIKDFIVKSKTMEGYHAPYVPGWDCHGLPIEALAQEAMGLAGTSQILERGVAGGQIIASAAEGRLRALYVIGADPLRTVFETDVVEPLGATLLGPPDRASSPVASLVAGAEPR